MSYTNFKLIERGNGWAELCFDQPDSKANVFNESAIRELDKVTSDLAARKDLKGVVVTSAKSDIFIAGADINLIKSLDTIDKALQGCTAGQRRSTASRNCPSRPWPPSAVRASAAASSSRSRARSAWRPTQRR